MERERAAGPERAPEGEAPVRQVRASVEQQLRTLLHLTAAAQEHARVKKRKELLEKQTTPGEAPPEEKRGWAEVLYQRVSTDVRKVMYTEKKEEWDTLETSIAAETLRGIVESGKVGTGDVPQDFRKAVADFCAAHGQPEHWWPAALRALWLLGFGRSIGISRAPEGVDLEPATRQYLGSLHYEFGAIKEEKHIGVEGRARPSPKQVVAKLQSQHPVVQQAGFHAFSDNLDGWVSKPPPKEEDRKAHFTDVQAAIGVAVTTPIYLNLPPEQKRHLSLRVEDAHRHMARKSGAA